LSQFSNIIKTIKTVCRGDRTDKEFDLQRYVTREEYELLKDIVLELKSNIKNLTNKINGDKA
jgi:hypothetical protein